MALYVVVPYMGLPEKVWVCIKDPLSVCVVCVLGVGPR